jgi:hypothetical protein
MHACTKHKATMANTNKPLNPKAQTNKKKFYKRTLTVKLPSLQQNTSQIGKTKCNKAQAK